MDGLRLTLPAPEHEAAAAEFVAEFRPESGDSINGSGGIGHAASYEEWLRKLRVFRDESTVPEGFAPSTTFFCVRESDGLIVGIIDVRHELTEFLMQHGGHIGYSVRPSERGQGYATEMLALALDVCRELGIKRVLLTCDKSNPASARVMIKNGAVLENEVMQDDGELLQRYWIEL